MEPAEQPPAQPAEAAAELVPCLPQPEALPSPRNFRELVALFSARREGLIEFHLSASVRLVRFEPGVIEINPLDAAPPNLASRVGTLLSAWTGRRWVVGISSAAGQPPLAETEKQERAAAFDSARASPTVRAILDAFPGAVITDVRELGRAEPDADAGDASPDMDLTLENGDES